MHTLTNENCMLLVLTLIIHHKLNTRYNRAQYKFPVPVQLIHGVVHTYVLLWNELFIVVMFDVQLCSFSNGINSGFINITLSSIHQHNQYYSR